MLNSWLQFCDAVQYQTIAKSEDRDYINNFQLPDEKGDIHFLMVRCRRALWVIINQQAIYLNVVRSRNGGTCQPPNSKGLQYVCLQFVQKNSFNNYYDQLIKTTKINLHFSGVCQEATFLLYLVTTKNTLMSKRFDFITQLTCNPQIQT